MQSAWSSLQKAKIIMLGKHSLQLKQTLVLKKTFKKQKQVTSITHVYKLVKVAFNVSCLAYTASLPTTAFVLFFVFFIPVLVLNAISTHKCCVASHSWLRYIDKTNFFEVQIAMRDHKYPFHRYNNILAPGYLLSLFFAAGLLVPKLLYVAIAGALNK